MLLKGMARNKIDATESWGELLEVCIMGEKRRFTSKLDTRAANIGQVFRPQRLWLIEALLQLGEQ
jgi:hypothetical protein